MHKPSSASGKPKALFLSPEAPYPAIGGGPLRSASLLEYLARRFSVHAVVFREPRAPDPASAIPATLIAKLDVLNLPHHSKNPVARALRNSMRLARNTPPLMDRFSGFPAAIAAFVSGNRYDVAIIEHFWTAPYIEQLRPHAKRVILDLHNIESVWFQTQAAFEGRARGLAMRRFATASVALERKLLPEFDALLAASARDAERLRSLAPHASVTVYPNSLPEISAPPRADREEIVFSGNLEYAPNVTAVRFFRDRIWPSLRSRWPNLRWKVLGKNPEAVSGMLRGDPRIELTGFVEDAVASLAEAQVAVVPILTGSGTRVKILEAWAAATPVVSTTLGAEGLDCRDGQHLLLADDPTRFIDAVSRLLASPGERQRIGAAGRRLLEQSYTWPAAWRSLEPMFGNLGARK
jgi:glycosyltransferase involved in cell wall biosynthesis